MTTPSRSGTQSGDATHATAMNDTITTATSAHFRVRGTYGAGFGSVG
jgi:hypothetical protein